MDPLIIGQISDMHVRAAGQMCYRVVDTGGALRRCVERMLAIKPQPHLVLVTGDLVAGGAREEYDEVRRLLSPLPMPWYLIPGNHDNPAVLRESFPDHAYLRQWPPFIQYTVDEWPLRVVALDTVVPGEDGGRLCDERLAWLDTTLAQAREKPTLIIMHHPPFRTWIDHMDAMALEAPERFAAVLAKHPQVERILCGHLHRPIEARIAGVPVSTCPGTAHQVALDLTPDAPANLIMEPPAYQLHLWSAQGGLVTHTVYINDYPGPYPFDD